MKAQKDGQLFLSRQGWHFFCVVYIIKVLFPISTLTWRLNICVFCQGKDINGRNESISIANISLVETLFPFISQLTVVDWKHSVTIKNKF